VYYHGEDTEVKQKPREKDDTSVVAVVDHHGRGRLWRSSGAKNENQK